MLDGFLHDLHLAFRQVRARPGFSAAVILTLAFGIGLTTAAFAALYKVVLYPIPFQEPQQLVVVHNRFAGLDRLNASPLDYRDLQARGVFESIGGYYYFDLNRTGVERPEKINAIAVTGSLFRVLNAAPMLGRTFTPDEDRYGGPHAVVISESYWRTEFAADPAILERTLQLNGEPYPITGVMPATFVFPNEVTQMWVPLAFQPRDFADPARASYGLRTIARLKPAATFEQASVQIGDLVRQWAADAPPGSPRSRAGWEMFLVPMARDNDGSQGRWITILFATVCCLVVIVCANVGGLFLVRSRERRLDLAVRVAMGANRIRIARQVLAEVFLLAAAGGAFGMLLSFFGASLIGRFGPVGRLDLNGAAVVFAIALTALTGLISGAYPAWSAARLTPMQAVADGGRTTSRSLWQRGFVVAQIGTATTLMISGALLIQSLTRLLHTPLGFDAHNITALQISLPPERYVTRESRDAFWREFSVRAAAVPGVQSLSHGSLLPFGYGENTNVFEVVGKPKPTVDAFANMNYVGPHYFEVLRIPLIRGRYLESREPGAGQAAVVIDQTLAARYFAGEDPLGQKIKVTKGIFNVVGVVGSVKVSRLNDELRPALYFVADAFTDSVVIRTAPNAGEIVNGIRAAVNSIDKDQPIYDVLPMEAMVERSVRIRAFVVWLMGVFSSAGTLFAAFGLYGLLSYTLATRRREIGIRMAVGADARAIASLICRGGFQLIGAGVAIGSLGALAAEALIASQLYGIRFTDARTWALVLFAIGAAGLAACAVPAWRAGRVNPVDVLKSTQ